MPTYNVNQFYFGTFADLDPTEASNTAGNLNNDVSERSEVAGWIKNTVFTEDTMRMVAVRQNDTVREGYTTRLEENDFKNRAASQGGPMAADSLTYNLGAGNVTSDIDSTFTWEILVTRGDGTTFTQVQNFLQLENGAIFSNFTGTMFNGQKIQSIKLVNYSSGSFFGSTSNRSLTGVEIVCFTAETMILTPSGEVPAGQLAIGDLVVTRDRGALPIRWLRRRRLGAAELRAKPQHLPIRIRKGVLGPDLPTRDLCVSPQHRILIRSRIADRLYSTNGVLLAAKHMLDHPGVAVDQVGRVTYVHFAFDQHEVVFAEGAPVESFYPGPMAIEGMDPEARNELFQLFPDLALSRKVEPARLILSSKEGRNLIRRHGKNRVPLLSMV